MLCSRFENLDFRWAQPKSPGFQKWVELNICFTLDLKTWTLDPAKKSRFSKMSWAQYMLYSRFENLDFRWTQPKRPSFQKWVELSTCFARGLKPRTFVGPSQNVQIFKNELCSVYALLEVWKPGLSLGPSKKSRFSKASWAQYMLYSRFENLDFRWAQQKNPGFRKWVEPSICFTRGLKTWTFVGPSQKVQVFKNELSSVYALLEVWKPGLS